MNMLIISKDCDSTGLAQKLVQEGNSVKFYVQAERYNNVCSGFGVQKTQNWRDELAWVGKDGLIIFDYTGFGKIQDDLRAQGYSVVGGSEGAERLELERDFAYAVLKEHGLETLPLNRFANVQDAMDFIKAHSGPWVIKHNGDVDKTLTYVGRSQDDEDVIDLLNAYRKNRTSNHPVVLQKKVDGVEIAVARFFNGDDWAGPIEINIEHKDLFNGNLGPKTAEMGTLLWFVEGEENRLFKETLAKLKPYLQTTGFRGDIDINCIVNAQGIFPLEVTARFGYPAIAVESALFQSPCGEFLKAVADGSPFAMKWQRGFGIVVQIAVPPFPYTSLDDKYSSEGLRIHFSEKLSRDEQSALYFNDVLCRQNGNGGEYVLVAKDGYALCVTGTGRTIQEARENTYRLVNKIIIPKMFYRTDIGQSFVERDGALLREWGYA